MKKKTYTKPLVSLYAIEASTILVDSPGTPVKPSPGFQGPGDVISGDNEDVWENN